MDDRYVKSDENKKILYMDATNLYGHSMFQMLPYDVAIYVGFAILELSKLHMYETYYDTLQPYFDQESLQLHYIDTDGVILSMNAKDYIKDLKNFEGIFDFSNLDKKHKLFSKKNKKMIGKFKIETPKKIG